MRSLRSLVVLLVLVSCARTNDPDPPRALGQYISAVKAGDFSGAYRRTDFAQAQPYAGFALTEQHFAAFYRANPLRSSRVVRVFKPVHRKLEGDKTTDAPTLYLIDMELTYPDGVRKETWHIEGDVLGIVELETSFVVIKSASKLKTVFVDGVSTPVAPDGNGQIRLTLMNGPHRVKAGTATLELVPEPLVVRSGPAVVKDGVIELTAGRAQAPRELALSEQPQ